MKKEMRLIISILSVSFLFAVALVVQTWDPESTDTFGLLLPD